MQVTVVAPDDHEAIRSFAEWCRQEPDLRGVRIRQSVPTPNAGEMGSVADALEFVSNNEALITAMATTLGAWLGTRRTRTRIRVKAGDREVEIDSPSPDKAQEIARRIIQQLGEGEPR